MAALQNLTLEQQIKCTIFGASFTSLCTTPLDVVKVRLQSEQKNTKKVPLIQRYKVPLNLCNCSKLFSSVPTRFEHTCTNTCFRENPRIAFKINEASTGALKTSMDVCKMIARKEGILSLWSGLGPALLMSVPGTMVYYTSYDKIKYKLGYMDPDPSKLYIPTFAGIIARVAAVTLVSPIELLRTKMQSKSMTYTQTLQCLCMSVRQEGVSVLFKGLGPSLLRDVPFSAIYWLSYEGLKAQYSKKNTASSPPPFVVFIAGALSGALAALLTCPLDVAKTHRQIELGESMKGRERGTTWSLLKALYKSKGPKALFAGIAPRLVKIAPACAIMITSYEMGKSYFNRVNQRDFNQ